MAPAHSYSISEVTTGLRWLQMAPDVLLTRWNPLLHKTAHATSHTLCNGRLWLFLKPRLPVSQQLNLEPALRCDKLWGKLWAHWYLGSIANKVTRDWVMHLCHWTPKLLLYMDILFFNQFHLPCLRQKIPNPKTLLLPLHETSQTRPFGDYRGSF